MRWSRGYMKHKFDTFQFEQCTGGLTGYGASHYQQVLRRTQASWREMDALEKARGGGCGS